MNRKYVGALAAFLAPLACGNVDDFAVEALPPQAELATVEAPQVFKIGVLVDETSPAKSNFIAAANLAEAQLNQGLQQAGAAHRFDIIPVTHPKFDPQPAAIDLINNQGALAIVAGEDEATALVNELNYELTPRIVHNFPVSCYQCSSPRFHDIGDTRAGFADTSLWLFRSFFTSAFESPVQVRIWTARANGGDFKKDGHRKIVVYYDPANDINAFNLPNVVDTMISTPHSTEIVLRTSDVASDMGFIFDTAPDGHAPDVVYFALAPERAIAALTDYKSFNAPSKPPVQLNEAVRRDVNLAALIATGVSPLEGTGVRRVASTASGPMFKSAFEKANNNKQPEVTSAYLYDATILLAGGIGWAFHFGSTDPSVIAGNVYNVNDPTGKIIRPQPSDFKIAAQRINTDQPINYDGAASAVDIFPPNENYPDLIHWKVQSGKYSELEAYRCDLDNPTCVRR